jgi:benzoyl-CoA reductase/2-hydroxyglutaryl-CoA dehydratase subunit BcrC/BadD/HgdB
LNFLNLSSILLGPDVIGITTTIPVEIVCAAGRRPVDLNNLFITSPHPRDLISQAEALGFSRNICAWIKGIYSTVIQSGIQEVIVVTGGDCSNSIALGELLARRGVKVFTFEYPQDRNPERLWEQMDKLINRLGTTWDQVETTKAELDRIRAKLRRLDHLTWRENTVTGLENHLFLVASSDFNGDPQQYEQKLDHFLLTAEKRRPLTTKIRLGYLGVPPVFSGFYECFESLGARVVFNEVQRQFSMPFELGEMKGKMVDQYLSYTYPYGIDMRLLDIKRAIGERRLHGLVHYTQTFCHRQLYDMIIREEVGLPVLTLEGDQPGPIDARTAIRIETFLEMLQGSRRH